MQLGKGREWEKGRGRKEGKDREKYEEFLLGNSI